MSPWIAAHQAPLSFTISWSMLRLMSIESMMLSNHLILCHPLLLPSILPSIRVFSNKSAVCIRWPKYRSFSISPSNEYSGLSSFRINWLDLLAVQGSLKSLLQHNLKASVLPCSIILFINKNVKKKKPTRSSFFFSPCTIMLETLQVPKRWIKPNTENTSHRRRKQW